MELTETGDGYTLTLNDVSSQTIFFSDRPDRIAGYLDIGDFIEEWSVGTDSFADNPPNAAITVMAGDDSNILVVELMNPKYDVDAMTLQYDAKVLEGDKNGFFATNGDDFPEAFDTVSVFIDASVGVDACILGMCVSLGGHAEG